MEMRETEVVRRLVLIFPWFGGLVLGGALAFNSVAAEYRVIAFFGGAVILATPVARFIEIRGVLRGLRDTFRALKWSAFSLAVVFVVEGNIHQPIKTAPWEMMLSFLASVVFALLEGYAKTKVRKENRERKRRFRAARAVGATRGPTA